MLIQGKHPKIANQFSCFLNEKNRGKFVFFALFYITTIKSHFQLNITKTYNNKKLKQIWDPLHILGDRHFVSSMPVWKKQTLEQTHIHTQTWKMSKTLPEQDFLFPDIIRKCTNYVNFEIATKQRYSSANTMFTTFIR